MTRTSVLADALNAALSSFGLPTHSRAAVCSFVGNGMKNLVSVASGLQDEAAIEKVLKTFKTHYAAHCKDKTKPYDGIVKLLQTLQLRGVKTAVLSNKADASVKALAKEYFDGLFDEVVGENEANGVRKKPYPDALFAIMQRLGISKEETLYVGDSDVDIRTAENAGVACVSVTWGFRDRRFLIENGAKTLVSSPEQIADII